MFTGVSGSGKSSLVFDTIAAESQRLINEAYSAFVQGFMPTLARPDVDVLDGLTTAIIVDQERMGAKMAAVEPKPDGPVECADAASGRGPADGSGEGFPGDRPWLRLEEPPQDGDGASSASKPTRTDGTDQSPWRLGGRSGLRINGGTFGLPGP